MQRSEETVWTPNYCLKGNSLLEPIEDTEMVLYPLTAGNWLLDPHDDRYIISRLSVIFAIVEENSFAKSGRMFNHSE